MRLTYALVFGWWLGKLLARRADKQLAKDVRNNLIDLFSEHAAKVVPNDEFVYPRNFDHAVATVVTTDIHLRFVRARGEFSIDLALPDAPHKWESLDSALGWLEIQRGIRPTPDYPSWAYGFNWSELNWYAIDHFLSGNWDLLKEAARTPGIAGRVAK